MNIFTHKNVKGFTLVEILVSVAIISIMATVVFATVGQMKKKARDAQRYSDLENIQLALRMYRDANGTYPSTSGTWRTVCTNGSVVGGPYTRSGASGYIPDLAPEFISILPEEPSGCVSNGGFKGYIYASNGTDYKFATDWGAEIGEKCKLGQKFADPARTNEGQYMFCSVYTAGYSSK